VVQTKNLAVGDVIATPDGPADILLISIERVTTQAFGINGSPAFVTFEHPFPKYGTPSYGVNSVWYSYVTAFDIAVWPWLTNSLESIDTGSSLITFNAATNTTSQTTVTSISSPQGFRGNVYTYVAWPRNSPTRVPNLYMIGYDYVAYGVAQADVVVAASEHTFRSAEELAYPILKNSAPWANNQSVSNFCWQARLALVHGPYLRDTLEATWTTQNPSTPHPTAEPANWEGPASEFIDYIHDYYATQGSRRGVRESQGGLWASISEEDAKAAAEERGGDGSYLGALIYSFAMGPYRGQIVWLNWVSFEAANATISATLEQFDTYINSYDYTSIANACVRPSFGKRRQ